MKEHWDIITQKLLDVTKSNLTLEDVERLREENIFWNKTFSINIVDRIEWLMWTEDYLKKIFPDDWKNRMPIAEQCICFYCPEIEF